MKTFFLTTIILFFFACNTNSKKIENCPSEIAEKKYCDLYSDALWCFYASNSHGKFVYRDTSTKKNVVLKDILSADLSLYKWTEKSDTIEFVILTDKKYDLDNIEQKIRFNTFGFNKKTRKLIYRNVGGITENNSKITKGYVFYTGDNTYKVLDSAYKNNPNYSVDMRTFGLYPLNEQDSILIAVINSGRKDINVWLLDYAKQKGFVK